MSIDRIVVAMLAEGKGGLAPRRGLRWLVVACLLAWPLPCLAQAPAAVPPTANEPPTQQSLPNEPIAEARESFTLGATLARKGRWVDALVAFERSYRLHPHATTLFNIGFCERALGRFTRARKSFRAALAASTAGQQGLKEDLALEAQQYLEEVERRIVRATVVIRQRSLRLTINGRPLEAETLQADGRTFFVAGTRDTGPAETPPATTFELLLDPGEQTIVISSDGVAHILTRRFDAGSSPRIELSAPRAPRARLAARPGGAGRSTASMTFPAIAYGVGAAGMVVGTVFGIATLQNAKDLSDSCPQENACPKEAQADIDASKRNALVSNVGFAVGLAGAVVGTYLLLTSEPPRSLDAHRGSPVVRARLGVGHVNIEGSF
jgi:hypothetical protein